MRRVLSLRSSFCALVRARRATSSFTPKRIDTVPAALHKHVFGAESRVPDTAADGERLARLIANVPCLKGKNIEEHFQAVSERQAAPYRELLHEAASWTNRPRRPAEWERRKGWTRYGRDGTEKQEVPHPLERAIFYDVEVCVTEGKLPTLATALSGDSWYSWCSDRVVDPDGPKLPEFSTRKNLIPLGGTPGGEPRIAIGHNVAYDRVRAAEPYSKELTSLRFWDTMSMSLPLMGMADHQRLLYERDDTTAENNEGWMDAWKARVSRNSLADVYETLTGKKVDKAFQKFFVTEPMEEIVVDFQRLMTYCADDVDATRTIFEILLPKWLESYPHPASLAGTVHMSDAYLPINQYWRMFYKRSESDSHMKIGAMEESVVTAAKESLKLSQNDIFMFTDDWSTKKDGPPSWFSGLFSSKTNAKDAFRDKPFKDGDLKMKSNIIPKLFGLTYGPYPMYFFRDRGWGYLVPPKKDSKVPPTLNAGTASKPRYVDIPIEDLRAFVSEQEREHGAIPLESIEKARLITDDMGGCTFVKLPKEKEKDGNVGFPLSKDYIPDIKSGLIRPTRHVDLFASYLEAVETTAFWKMFRARYNDELPIWYDEATERTGGEGSAGDAALGREKAPPTMLGAIAAGITPAGTISRRSVHKLWVTATNASNDQRIGTGLKSMIQAHPGTLLIGADVDSQEQWLAALYGDASASAALPPDERTAGCTPFSNMMLAGSRSDNSDLHSVVAANLGISRHIAKVLNYARLYGSGVQHCANELATSAGLSKEAAGAKAAELFALTKGVDGRYLQLRRSARPFFEAFLAAHPHLNDSPGHVLVSGEIFLPVYGNYKASEITLSFEDWMIRRVQETAKREGREEIPIDHIIPLLYDDCTMTRTAKFYTGGYESDTFTFLELAATRDDIRTPVLSAALTSSLSHLPKGTPDAASFASKYKRSVINWVVQSSAVDFLHLLLVCLQDFITDYNIRARFSISIHDEVRYIVQEEDKDRFALALMLANLYVRSFITARLGIQQMPMTCAFFSQVDVDTVLRKEVATAVTNPDGSIVPNGTAMDIYAVIEATDGSLNKKEKSDAIDENENLKKTANELL